MNEFKGILHGLKKKSVVSALLELPNIIEFEGVTFERFLDNECDNLILVYSILGAEYNSPHKKAQDYKFWVNPFIDGGHGCGYLQFYDGIKNDDDLLNAIEEMKTFLTENKLI